MKSRSLLSLVILLSLMGLVVFAPSWASAQSVTPAPAGVDLGKLQIKLFNGGVGGDLFSTLQRIIGWILLIAGIAAFLYVLYGGFIYLTAGGDAAKTAQAQKTITNAIIGIILIAISYVLVLFVINTIGDRSTTTTTPAPRTTTRAGTTRR